MKTAVLLITLALLAACGAPPAQKTAAATPPAAVTQSTPPPPPVPVVFAGDVPREKETACNAEGDQLILLDVKKDVGEGWAVQWMDPVSKHTTLIGAWGSPAIHSCLAGLAPAKQ